MSPEPNMHSQAQHYIIRYFCVPAGLVCLADGRTLKQDPYTVTSSKGHQPAGIWARTGHDAEVGAASGAKGVRYNDGQITLSGDGTPGPLALGSASDSRVSSGMCAL
jgi:hypothetical protein